MPGIRVDGNDVLAVYQATKEAVERARRGEGPSLIEAVTYRFTPHTTADDPKRYRSEEEALTWQKREPLARFARYLEEKGALSASERAMMEEEVDSEIKAAVKLSEELAKTEEILNPLSMINYMYAELPQNLLEQREELALNIQRAKKSKTESKEKKAPSPAQI
jgi:TPP-dependent pyruvate/acetoin dehydrogenase alpha subunit